MKKILDLSGIWQAEVAGMGSYKVVMPGTLDTNGIGQQEDEDISTRLTRVKTFEGCVRYHKRVLMPEREHKRLFLKVERSKELSLKVDGVLIQPWKEGTLSTESIFEMTDFAGQEVVLEIVVDNAYTNWPRTSIIGASASTDETQTNWNGILGEFCIFEESCVFISSLRIYPGSESAIVYVQLEGVDEEEFVSSKLEVTLQSDAFELQQELQNIKNWEIVESDSEEKTLCLKKTQIRWKYGAIRWDEGLGMLYQLHAVVIDESGKRKLTSKSEIFGIRTFSVDKDYRLNINNRKFFLRSEANCCVFPEKGHPPMSVTQWRDILHRYASYGVNCIRFHSWCPPKAAFEAADQMGMLMQPELSQWNFKDAFGEAKARDYYFLELKNIVLSLSNHPSFVMLTFGNELQYTEEGLEWANHLCDWAKAYDPTRLYAISSNYHYGEKGVDVQSDFYTAMALEQEMLRATSSPMIGHLNQTYPSACHNYNDTIDKIRKMKKPVFGFEVGQYEILPDFEEINKFRGVTKAINYERIKMRAQEAGLIENWSEYVEATGELSLQCYKEEVEAALRTEGMSGLSLLGLQDFPGQGTALVGMMDSHLDTKPYAFARPDRFHSFFHEIVPLLYLTKYTYQNSETLTAKVKLANYSKHFLQTKVTWEVWDRETLFTSGFFEQIEYPNQGLSEVGTIQFEFPKEGKSKNYEIQIRAGEFYNTYPIWSYANNKETMNVSYNIVTKLTEDVLKSVELGKAIFLEPKASKENFPNSIGGQFTTDFWSVGTFPEQEGGMGLLIDAKHKALALFPTQAYSQFQWWPMTSGRPVILPKRIHPIVTVPDSCSRLWNMGLLFEVSVGLGKIMISSMGLLDKQEYPECRALLGSILQYLEQDKKLENIISLTREELVQIVAADLWQEDLH